MDRIYGLPSYDFTSSARRKLERCAWDGWTHLLLVLNEYLESLERDVYFVFRDLDHCYSRDWGSHFSGVALKCWKGVVLLRKTKLELIRLEVP